VVSLGIYRVGKNIMAGQMRRRSIDQVRIFLQTLIVVDLYLFVGAFP
jgi:hypothetical protein